MVTEAIRRAVWNDLLDVSRVARYAEAMAAESPVRPRRTPQPDISCSMATISFSTRWMSASISSRERGGRYS